MTQRQLFMFGILLLTLVVATGCMVNEYSQDLAKALPEKIDAQGWLNSEPLTDAREQLLGNVVVIDCWAHWCGPCRQLAPTLEASYSKFGETGQVKFVGITPDKKNDLPKIEAFLDDFDHRWPVAYGASEALKTLGVRALPTVMVFDREGRAVWNSFEPGSLNHAIKRALAAD